MGNWGEVTLLLGVISSYNSPFITGSGPPCTDIALENRSKPKRKPGIVFQSHQLSAANKYHGHPSMVLPPPGCKVILIPIPTHGWNPKMEVDASDDFPDFNWVIFFGEPC